MSKQLPSPPFLPSVPRADLAGVKVTWEGVRTPAADAAFAEALTRKCWANVERVLLPYAGRSEARQLELKVARGLVDQLVAMARAVVERSA